jgi:hypothetical protein
VGLEVVADRNAVGARRAGIADRGYRREHVDAQIVVVDGRAVILR